jgi:hypothetical protein
LYEFSMAKEVPDAELLDRFVKRYPEYAAAITDFAIEVVADALRLKGTPAVETQATVSPEVSRAMSTYQNALYAKGAKAKADAVEATSERQRNAAPNPFASLDRQSFRALAAELNMNNVLLMKLRDRQIDPATISDGFRRFVAEKLKVTKEVVDSFFAHNCPQLASQFYKSEAKPETQVQQSFESAVQTCGLSEAQRNFLLDL